MFKRMISLIIMFVVTATIGSAFSASEFSGNKRKGKYQLRKIYKACKKRGEVDSATPSVSPADRTQAQWKELYTLLKENKDAKAIEKKMAKFGCKEEWGKVKEKTLLNIFTYMYEHASDSSTPAKCK